jgi:D-amino-acid dehydrogenase
MACGTARVLVDQIMGKPPAIDVIDLAISRYR